jgi:hypothetical protein
VYTATTRSNDITLLLNDLYNLFMFFCHFTSNTSLAQVPGISGSAMAEQKHKKDIRLGRTK